ncbi:hypothetical protein H6A60_06200 [Sutterella massiliensis]|uniref:DNA polymerase III tau subunit domain-containing protein n=1 Tax=Sutterella massiliensis TaxID=1816689 RepID=A0ABS2DRY2_9BURK|nr:DNA polymerase III subunit gamma/tau C-terminal domain-containing protein [Sutterella massiliensis]MBM6704077.1 hypothetical protein [Sutterella massiliensis]
MSEPPRAQQAPRAGEQLNWRNIIDGARFSGPVRMLASQSQVLKLEENRVQLRLNVAALATEANRRLMAQKLSDYFGRPFRVEFEVGSLDAGSTVADAQRAERAKAHAELVERFKNDPLVKEVLRVFGGTIDEDSIRPISDDEHSKNS